MDNETAWITRRDAANLLGGLALLLLGFAGIQYAIDSVTNWLDVVSVCLAYFLLMPVASRLFWKGVTSLAVVRRPARHQTPVMSRPSYCRNLLGDAGRHLGDELDSSRVGLGYTGPLSERRPHQPFDEPTFGNVVTDRIVNQGPHDTNDDIGGMVVIGIESGELQRGGAGRR